MKDVDEANNPNPELSAVVGALLDTLNDKDETVQLSATESIRKLSQKNPFVVIHATVYFWELHRKISQSHLVAVLKIMTDICENLVTPLDETLATSVADLALTEFENNMTEEAIHLLAALSKTQCSQAVGALIIKFKPNTIPHHSIIRAIGMIAGKNPIGILPFIKVTLSVMEPLLPEMNEEQIKLATTIALGKISDAIHDCLTNTEIVNNTGLNKDIFYEELSSAFEVLTYNWLRTSRNMILTESILTSLTSILPLLPKAYDEKLIVKVVPVLLNFCKKFNVRLPASRLLALILNTATDDVKELLRPYLEQIHQILSEIISVAPFDAARDALLTHYEVLQCFRAIVVLYPEEGLDRILQQLRSQNITQRSRALVVLRHLINTLPAEDDAALQRIALSLQDSLGEGSTRHIVGAIVALAARPTFPLLPSQRSSFIKFMVLHCGMGTDEGEACEEALHLLSSTVEGAETWLWPLLIKALLDKTYEASVISILRALVPLAVKIIRDEDNLAAEKDFQSLKVFARCLELLENERNGPAVVTFLRCTAPLLGHQLKPHWDVELMEISKFLELHLESITDAEKTLIWEEKMVTFLERSVNLEGQDWSLKLAEELIVKTITPSLSIFLAAVASNPDHIKLLIELARTNSIISSRESPSLLSKYARAVGVCAKNHLDIVLKIMEEFCNVEDSRKQPVKLLGLVKDTKAAATNEAAKAGLLWAYTEIARKGDATVMFPVLEKHTLPWIVRQLNDCKKLSTKEAGLIALEQAGAAIHPSRLPNSTGFRSRGNALAILLKLYQLSSGYRPLQLYPMILKAIIALIKIPPVLLNEEKEVLLETTMEKVIEASSQIEEMKMPQVMQQLIECLGIISSEMVSDSPDTLASLVDFLKPWMQSRSSAHRRTTLLILRTTLRSYYDSLKYTYPGGKLEPGKLLGMILSWSADPDLALRPLVVDCVALALNIGARYRSTVPDNNLNQDLNESKRIIVSEDTKLFYEGVKTLASAACERVAYEEIISLTHGLVEGLLYRGEGGIAAGIALSELFKIRGSDIPRSNLHLVVTIIEQMRLIDNASCKKRAAMAIKALSIRYPEEIIEHLLHQPLPLDSGTKECWKELGKSKDTSAQSMELLLRRLQNESELINSNSSADNGKRSTAEFLSLAAVVAIGELLSSPKSEDLVEWEIVVLIGTLLKYLGGWLHVDPPMSIISTKFGFVPNRETCKIIPHKEVYSVLTKVLNIVGMQDIISLSNKAVFESESEAEENLVGIVHALVQCLPQRNSILQEIARCIDVLVTSSLPAQRAVVIAFYAELIGKENFNSAFVESAIYKMQKAKSDSSPLVRKLATIGLARVAFLEPTQVNEHIDKCLSSLMNGLEEPVNAEGSTEVVLESLKGLSVLVSVKMTKTISPRIIMGLKPFVEKENYKIKLAAINAVGATIQGWQKFVESPNDDVTDTLLGCISCLVIKLEDGNETVALASKKVLFGMAHLTQCEPLADVMNTHLKPENKFIIEKFLRDLINCLKAELPIRAEELRNATVRGYSKSENGITRATSALILGLFGEPRPEDIQRLLQLLHDKENFVRARAARGLALCFTL